MNVYIQSVNKFPLLFEGVICLWEFRNKAVNVFLYEDKEEIPLNRNTLLIASIEDTKWWFEQMGFYVDYGISFPTALENSSYWKRKIGIGYLPKEQHEIESFLHRVKQRGPLFIKPKEVKAFDTNFVFNKTDLDRYMPSVLSDTQVIISETVEMQSEWRVYIQNGSIMGVYHYKGDPELVPKYKTIYNIIKEYKNAPIAYALDVAVLEDLELAIVEVNDFWSLGNYGLAPNLYVRGICARWREILEQNPVKQ